MDTSINPSSFSIDDSSKNELLTKEMQILNYQIIIDRELIFSALGYKDFCDDGEKKEIGKEKSKKSWGGYDYCLSLNIRRWLIVHSS